MQTDLSTIMDPKELKAMAYDQIAAKEQAENNLRAINARLSQVLGLGAQPQSANQPASSVSDEDLGIEDKSEDVE